MYNRLHPKYFRIPEMEDDLHIFDLDETLVSICTDKDMPEKVEWGLYQVPGLDVRVFVRPEAISYIDSVRNPGSTNIYIATFNTKAFALQIAGMFEILPENVRARGDWSQGWKSLDVLNLPRDRTVHVYDDTFSAWQFDRQRETLLAFTRDMTDFRQAAMVKARDQPHEMMRRRERPDMRIVYFHGMERYLRGQECEPPVVRVPTLFRRK